MQKHSCRLCSNAVAPMVSVALFSRESQRAEIPGRLSRVLDLPITESDGLSKYICRPCKRKFIAAESFRAMARSAYDKRVFADSQTPEAHPTCPEAQPSGTRKRPKSTSGVDVSPTTSQARPAAKRTTTGTPGRRLCFSSHKDSKKKMWVK